jgi:hypothetical protein
LNELLGPNLLIGGLDLLVARGAHDCHIVESPECFSHFSLSFKEVLAGSAPTLQIFGFRGVLNEALTCGAGTRQVAADNRGDAVPMTTTLDAHCS